MDPPSDFQVISSLTPFCFCTLPLLTQFRFVTFYPTLNSLPPPSPTFSSSSSSSFFFFLLLIPSNHPILQAQGKTINDATRRQQWMAQTCGKLREKPYEQQPFWHNPSPGIDAFPIKRTRKSDYEQGQDWKRPVWKGQDWKVYDDCYGQHWQGDMLSWTLGLMIILIRWRYCTRLPGDDRERSHAADVHNTTMRSRRGLLLLSHRDIWGLTIWYLLMIILLILILPTDK